VADEAPVSSRVLDKLDDLAGEVTEVKVAIARLETKLEHLAPKSGLARDGAITVSGGAIGSALLFLIQHLAK
jgi:hypothetical protein